MYEDGQTVLERDKTRDKKDAGPASELNAYHREKLLVNLIGAPCEMFSGYLYRVA